MRASLFFIHSTKEAPAEAELASHRLMLRAGFIRKHAGGIYSWLPAGWRAARKIAGIVREEMDAAGCAEILMPAVHAAQLWEESGRWKEYGAELLRFADRRGRDFCLAPTHEEMVTDIVRAHVSSYRQLPFNLYQIQTKFRDEIRPRFGVMRAREFIMKDAYSFDMDEEGMRRSYETMRRAYCRIFDRIGLRYRMVEADSGTIGGKISHEFMVLADSGEETVLYSPESGYAANLERAACPPGTEKRPPPAEELQKIDTPGVATIAALAEFLGERAPPPPRNIKTMLVRGAAGTAAVLLQGGHALNLTKAAAQPEIGNGADLLPAEEAKPLAGAGFGSLGPVNMPLPVIADFGLAAVSDFACGANEDGRHYLGANFGRDCPEPRFADVRRAAAGDPSPDGNGTLLECRGIEVGHIFQLGAKYSQAMSATAESPEGGALPIMMGCYGIGITRIAAAAVEQNHDARGMIFPDAIAPFQAVIAVIGARDKKVMAAAEKLYDELRRAGIDVLLDERDLRPGVMFAELDLLGIPHRLVIGARALANGETEYKHRTADKSEMLPLTSAAETVRQKIKT
ncbi:MAG: proline--tRNA ligase [Gammaproteobacteria bacterium]